MISDSKFVTNDKLNFKYKMYPKGVRGVLLTLTCIASCRSDINQEHKHKRE